MAASTSGSHRFLAGCMAGALLLFAATTGPAPAHAATAAVNEPIGLGEEPGRTEQQSRPTDEPPNSPGEASSGRFTPSRIITAAVLQALLLAAVVGLLRYRRSARRRNLVEGGSAPVSRGSGLGSQSGSRRRSSGPPVRSLGSDGEGSVISSPVSIRAVDRDESRYLCLSLADGRTIEGSLRGRESNGLVMVIDVDYVVEPDGTRRRGNDEDAFVPVSTIEHQRGIKGPRSA